MHNCQEDTSRIYDTVSLCRRVANTIRKCYGGDADSIRESSRILENGFRKRKLNDLDKVVKPMVSSDFKNFNVCCAYMVTYAACHSELTYIAMSLLLGLRNDLQLLIDSFGALNVTSINGGPGNDLLGLMYALSRDRSNLKELNLNIVDGNIKWQMFFSTLMSEVAANGSSNKLVKFIKGLTFSHHFVLGEITLDNKDGDVKEILKKSDLVILVQTLSLMTLGEKVTYLREIMKLMRKHAILLIVDNEWPSLVVLKAEIDCEILMDVRDIVACTKPGKTYNCENVTACVADAIALRIR